MRDFAWNIFFISLLAMSLGLAFWLTESDAIQMFDVALGFK